MRNQLTILLLSLFLGLELNAQILAGPYSPPTGQSGSTAIHKDSSVFVGWASSCISDIGWQNIADSSLGRANIGSNFSTLGKAALNGVLSLGDGGVATLTFYGTIYDGPGADFAIFENSFDGLFLELAFVEVSSDGINFYRFDSQSLTEKLTQTGTFGNTDATNLYNLAGKYSNHYGTPFDLNELTGITSLDINNVSHIRIIDVIGNITESYSSYDSQNKPINDPWPTPFPSGGFDLDAIGIINFMPTSINKIDNNIDISIYPNPTLNKIYFNVKTAEKCTYRLTDLNGSILSSDELKDQLDISHLEVGIYFIHISTEDNFVVKKIIKQ